MEAFILGKKTGMTQVWKDEKVIPVTVIKAAPNKIDLIRTKERDGYIAVRLSASAPVGRRRVHREFRLLSSLPEEIKAGRVVSVSDFSPGDNISVSGLSIGKGFQGVVKRHGFAGSKKTHGTKDRLRAPGSIGAGGVQRVFKGMRMGGRMGGRKITIKNLTVIAVNPDAGELLIKGAVPGNRRTLLTIRRLASALGGESASAKENKSN